jgi:hypothetical protein
MIWVAVASVVAFVILLLGFVNVLWSSHRRAEKRPGSFPCKVRVVKGRVAGFRDKWPRRYARAFWLHDVLFVQRGFGRLKMVLLPVEQPLSDVKADGGPRDHPSASMRLRLDDGAEVVAMVPALAREQLAGPYLTAAIGQRVPRRG